MKVQLLIKKINTLILTVFVLGIFSGFINSDNPGKSKTKIRTNSEKKAPAVHNALSGNPSSTDGYIVYYSDNFDAPNDTAGLIARGYSVYLNGTFAGGIPPNFWFTGITDVFGALNGDPNDYVGGNFQSGGSFGSIDNWLVLPDLDVVSGDSICFFSRSPLNSGFPDSIRVLFNPTNNTSPADPNWVELGRFKVNTAGVWEQKCFAAPSSGLSARFAIRYSVVDAGLFGNNSDYIGIDSLVVKGNGLLPVELTSFTSAVINNNVNLNWSTASERNNSGFEAERSAINGQWVKIGFINGSGTTTIPKNYSFTDNNLNSGNYNYRIKQIDFNGNFEYFNLNSEVIVGIPNKFELSQNYPNPFNPSTKIDFQLTNAGFVNLYVFDNSGKEVASLVNEYKPAGYFTINFNAYVLPSGVYFYKITSGNFSAVKKMLLIK